MGVVNMWNNLVIFVWAIIPIIHVTCVVIVIWWKKYLPAKTSTSRRSRGMRELTWYLCRVLAVFGLFWGPGIGLTIYSTAADKTSVLMVVIILVAVQPIVTAGMVLTKSDAQGYFRDFWGRLFCFCCIKNEDATAGVDDSSRIQPNFSINFKMAVDPEAGPSDPCPSDEDESISSDDDEDDDDVERTAD